MAQGFEATRAYFEHLLAEAVAIERCDIKAVIVGMQGAGKTR